MESQVLNIKQRSALNKLVARLEAAEAENERLERVADNLLIAAEVEQEKREAAEAVRRKWHLDAAEKAVKIGKLTRSLADTRRALERIRDNATGWHGPLQDTGHERALAVIADWCDRALAATGGGTARITHGRHCTCSACAREDWTQITAPCGMHGQDCPAVYAPLGPAGGGTSRKESYSDKLKREGGMAASGKFREADGGTGQEQQPPPPPEPKLSKPPAELIPPIWPRKKRQEQQP